MIRLTLEGTKELLKEAVVERGADYVDPDASRPNLCRNVHVADDGTPIPGCIVGWVLHKSGVSLELLSENNMAAASSVISELREGNVLTFEVEAQYLLDRVQDHQDKGVPWGTAVQRACGE